MCAAAGEEIGPWHAWERRPGGPRDPGLSCPGGHAAAFRPSWPGPHQGPPSHPHLFVSEARGPEVSRVRSITKFCGLRLSVESYLAPKGPMQCKRCQRFGHTQRNCGYAPRCVAYGVSQLSGGCSTPREQPQCCGCVGNNTANYRGCAKCKEAKAALANQAPQRDPRNASTGHPAAPKAQ